MPRAIWKGAVSFGLVSIPIRLFAATEEKDVSFRQVHSTDGGRVRYQRVCEKCGEVVAFADIAKGFEAADGRMAVLDKSDFDSLPLTTTKSVDVVQFVDEADRFRLRGFRHRARHHQALRAVAADEPAQGRLDRFGHAQADLHFVESDAIGAARHHAVVAHDRQHRAARIHDGA